MKKRSYKHYIRKSHRYLGVCIGIQFLFWTIGGFYFSWTNLKEIRGDHLKSESAEILPFDLQLVAPNVAVANLKNRFPGATISSVRLVRLFDAMHYELVFSDLEGDEKRRLVDAQTGSIREPIAQDDAVRIATAAMTVSPQVGAVQLITKENVGGHHEYREKPLPAWAVTFEHPEDLTVYLSAETGSIGAFRTNQWRVFDFLWMLHTMDFQQRDNINNWVLRGFSMMGLVTIASGFLLFFVSSAFFRRFFFTKSASGTGKPLG